MPRRSDGERSHHSILLVAAEMASVHGLEGLSIGGLASRVGMSKSGLFAHFASKEDLQLATIDAAAGRFEHEVLAPALDAPEGVARLVALCEAYLSYVERRVFPGGCFFAAACAEFSGRAGRVRDRVVAFHRAFVDRLAELVREAQRTGELDIRLDAAQMAFELEALLRAANAGMAAAGADAVRRARVGIDGVLMRSVERP